MPTCNFTLLARNRPNLTRQALASLGDDKNIFKTVFDDRSATETQVLLEHWQKWGRGNLVRNERPMGTGMARNAVIRASEELDGRKDYLYLSDNDVFFKPGWFEQLVVAYEAAWQFGFRVVGAYNHPFHQPGEGGVVIRQPEYGNRAVLDGGTYVKEIQALALQSVLMRWEVWDQHGPFCQTPVDRVCQSEDVDFARKIVADGGKLGVVSPALIVNTGITNSFGDHIPGWDLVKQQAPAGVIVE